MSKDTAIVPAASPQHSTNSSAEKLSPKSVIVIGTLLAATFVVFLNETILNVALPRLITELNVNSSTVQWLSTGFMLTMAIVIPTTGFILEKLTTRQAFLMSMGLFTLGTSLAAVAPGFGVLLTARIIQACGTAIVLPLLMTTILTLVPVSKRGLVMGNVTIAISVAPALGPTVSGFILEHFSWRFMFIFVLPITLLVIGIGFKFLTNVGKRGSQRLDVGSVILTVPAFGGIVYGLSQIGVKTTGGGPNVAAILALAAGFSAMALFVNRQLKLQRSNAPLLDLRAFTYKMFTISTLLLMVAMMALFGGVLLLPIYLQSVLDVSAQQTGLILLPGGLVMGITGPIVGRLFDKIGPLPLTLTGALLMVLCLFQYSQLTAHTPVWWIVVVQTTLSLGLAMLFTPAITTGLNPLPPKLYTHGSAIMSTLQQVAGAAGTALLVSIFALVSANGDLVAGMRAAFSTATLMALIALVLAGMMRRTLPSDAGQVQESVKQESA